jgi:hypothetical protein
MTGVKISGMGKNISLSYRVQLWGPPSRYREQSGRNVKLTIHF